MSEIIFCFNFFRISFNSLLSAYYAEVFIQSIIAIFTFLMDTCLLSDFFLSFCTSLKHKKRVHENLLFCQKFMTLLTFFFIRCNIFFILHILGLTFFLLLDAIFFLHILGSVGFMSYIITVFIRMRCINYITNKTWLVSTF